MEPRPSAPAVARRALCAGAVFTRGFIERNIQVAAQPRESWDPHARRLGGWLSEHQLLPQVTSRREVLLLAEPLGSWSAEDIEEVGWHSEAIGTLLWALGLHTRFPPYDQPFDAQEFEGLLPVLGDAGRFVAQARLLPEADIDRQRDAAELWHWRSRSATVRRATPEGHGPSGESIISRAARAAHQEGLLPPLIGDDFPVHGRPYRELGEGQLNEVASITSERQLALNWVCGSVRDWDEVSPSR